MDFARKQLEKYGWSDGKGLGRHENGISEALKPKLKRSMTGVGHNAASDFTEHWWTTLYNKAASNIEVKEKNGTTKKIKTKDDTGFEITNSEWKLKKNKSQSSDIKPQEQYENFFIRTAVLGSGGTKIEKVRQSESEDNQELKHVFKITDEELFAACEGRTAHKGARHGLKALGKLARIEQQEKLLLQQSRFKGYSHINNCIQKRDSKQEIVEIKNVDCNDVSTLKKNQEKCDSEIEIKNTCVENNKNCISKIIDKNSNISNHNIGKICDKVDSELLTQKVKKKKQNTKEKEENSEKYNPKNKIDSQNSNNTTCNIGKIHDKIDSELLPQKVKKKKQNTTVEEVNSGKIKARKKIDSQAVVLSVVKKNKKRKHLDVSNNENSDMDVDNLFKPKTNKKNKKLS